MKWQGAGNIASPFSLEATVDEPISQFEETYEGAEENLPSADSLWLLVMGVNVERWGEQAISAAGVGA